MADTTYSDGTTVILSSWLNDINDFFYTTHGGDNSAPADGVFLVGDGVKFVRESGATARTSLAAQQDVITTRGDIVRGSSGPAAERLAIGSSGQTLLSDGTDVAWGEQRIVQRVEATPYTTYSSTTTTVPLDDTIPQNTEGTQYLTLSITPKSNTNRLVLAAHFPQLLSSAALQAVCSLFQDSDAAALASSVKYLAGTGELHNISLFHEMAAGTTSSTTFNVRLGPTTGTLYINGNTGNRLFGGVSAARFSVTEYAS